MITKLTHCSLIVHNQEEAPHFFIEKLGFVKKDDNPMGEGQRWLTIGCQSQLDLEIILGTPEWSSDKASFQERRAIIGKQSFCFAFNDYIC